MVAPNTPSKAFPVKGSDSIVVQAQTMPLAANGAILAGLAKADGSEINPATAEGLATLAAIFGAAVASPDANTIGDRLKAIASAIAAAQLLGAGEAHIGQVGGDTVIATGSFARPADTIAYASGDLVANSVTPGSVAAVELTVARKAAGTGRISRARLTRSKGESGAFRIHLFRTAPVVQSASGDNLALLTDNAIGYLGAFDVTTDRVFSDGAKGFGVPVTGPFIAFETATGSQKLFALLEARGAVSPSSAETFTLALEVDRD